MAHRIAIRRLAILFAPLLAGPALADPWFEPLGFLHEFPTAIESHALGLSPDGSVAVGVDISHAGREAIRWTRTGGLVGMATCLAAPARTAWPPLYQTMA